MPSDKNPSTLIGAGAQVDQVDLVSAQLELGSKAVLALLGLVYALGLVVVTLHLGSYGAPAQGLARPQYILAGFWALLPPLFVIAVLAAVAALTFLFHEGLSKQPASKAWRVLAWLPSFAMAAFGGLGFVIITADLLLLGGNLLPSLNALMQPTLVVHTVNVTALLIGSAAFTTWASFMMLRGWQAEPRFKQVQSIGFALGYGTYALAASLGYAAFFAHTVFPLVPQEFGGGAPVQVGLTFAASAPMAVLRDALEMPDGTKTADVGLLLETANSYICASRSSRFRSVRIRKVDVQEVVLLYRQGSVSSQ